MFKFFKKILFAYNNYYSRNIFKEVNCDINSIVIGPDCNVNFNINSPEKLSIDIGTVINGYCYINAFGGVRIGKYCHIGKGLTIFSHNHNYNSEISIPYDDIDLIRPVEMKDFVWCGANVTIVPGVTIGEGVVIGSGTVITKDVPDYAVVGGNPHKILKYRNIETFKRLKENGQFC